MTTSFIKKNWQANAGKIAIEAGLRGLGAGAAAFTLNKWFDGKDKNGVITNSSQTLRNIMGPVFLGVGVLGDMMVEDSKVRSIFQGIATYSMLHSVAIISPEMAENMDVAVEASKNTQTNGTSGLGKLKSGINALGRIPRKPRKALGATDMNYTGNFPEELQIAAGQKAVVDTDGKTYNNDWAYLAENIDNADKISKTLNGAVADHIENQEAANLMGAASDEEAALLMGMF